MAVDEAVAKWLAIIPSEHMLHQLDRRDPWLAHAIPFAQACAPRVRVYMKLVDDAVPHRALFGV